MKAAIVQLLTIILYLRSSSLYSSCFFTLVVVENERQDALRYLLTDRHYKRILYTIIKMNTSSDICFYSEQLLET